MQKTLSSTLMWNGVGLHTGEECSITLRPSGINTGIRFISAADGGSVIGEVKSVSSTHRCTNLKNGPVEIMTVEHLMAAFHAAGITNVDVEVTGKEIPILDGSAEPFYSVLIKNIREQEAEALLFKPKTAFSFTDGLSGSAYTLIPSDVLSIEVIIDYNQSEVGEKYASFNELQDFAEEIGSARTFVFTHEVIHLANLGYIKGGSIDNALVLRSDNATEEQLREALEVLGKSNPDEIIEKINQGVRLKYDNELARHKLLDLYGDLALLGHRLKAKIIAHRPGHTGNVAFARKLKELLNQEQIMEGVPHYDPNVEPLYNIEQIKAMLPHRYPFLLVDKIIEMTDKYVVGIKNITFNENFFMGHFPGNSIFPGVLQMEALAQTGGILALSTVEMPSDWDTYFLKMDNVKFKKKVVPGDTLILKMELLAPIRRGIVQMRGTTYVGHHLASEGDLTAQIVDRTKLK